MRVSPNRWRFLQQALEDLDKSFRAIGTRLYVLHGKPEEIFPELLKEWNVKLLTFESDIEPYACKRDSSVMSIAKKFGVKVLQSVSHTLYNPEIIIKKNLGKAPLTYQKFTTVVDSIGLPPKPVDAPNALPKEAQPEDLAAAKYNVPTLAEFGLDVKSLHPTKFPGGETEGLARLAEKLSDKAWVCKFEKPNTSPNSLEPSTTVLSPYLKFGCVSARLFYYKVKDVISKAPHSKPPTSLIGQLFWREFYYTVASVTPNFHKMEGNPVCCQVPWDSNSEHLDAWAFGRTGYPFIDAIMRQLRQEGWIHHLARHAVACFLTRGDLWISWEEGQGVFEELLLDADWALNAGNWMWLSASAFFHQFFRVYSPVAFGKKTDKFGDYIKKYVPELGKYPSEYIYEPWNAPKSLQERAGCVIGVDYPKRIVIHENVYKNNIQRMSLAYKNNKQNTETTNSNPAGSSKSKTGKGGSTKRKPEAEVAASGIKKFLKKN
ncbi:unnamed protein product [Bemisia tabaci]|nr:unnamed protein product [Bemisia tabaci]